MKQPEALDFWECTTEILHRMRSGGVLCTVVDSEGTHNVLTLGWGQIGPFYHDHPVFSIAVTPLRYSWRFLEEVPDSAELEVSRQKGKYILRVRQ